ncbi:MAG: flagellar hook assembly protein FlgD [Vampirovibrionales bacterium]
MMSSNAVAIANQMRSIQNQTARVNFENGQRKVGQSALDKDSFMQLMLAQMQNQNPLEPKDSTAQLAQQAAFTQVEELQKLNKNLSAGNLMSQAASYVGKTVDYRAENGKIIQNARINSVSFGDGSIGLNIGNGKIITPEQIKQLHAS